MLRRPQPSRAIDLGPLQPRLPAMLRTQGQRLNLVHEILVRDLERLRQELTEPRAEVRLVLIGRRQLQNMNSWLHNISALAKGRERCTLLVNPEDAERLGINDGARAEIRSRVGAVTVPVSISGEMMPGVVSLPHGFGHSDAEARLRVANATQPGANSNQLCDEWLMDQPSGTSVTNGIPVEVIPVMD